METDESTMTLERPSTAGDADRELERRVISFLAARHVPGLRYLAVKATDGVVTVSGQVLTFYEKQLCNQCCRRVAGVMELINAVSVTGAPSAAVA
jgi:osmotically-inducible protein OsmY